MRLIPLGFLVVALAGCQLLGGRKTNSGWVVLEKTTGVECGFWPKQEKDLAVNELMLARGAKRGILSAGIKRDGSPNHYYLPFDDEVELEPETMIPLKLGRNAVLLGGAHAGGKPIVDVAFNVLDKAGVEKSTFEVRNAKDNLVRFKGELLPTSVVSGSVTTIGDVQWLVVKREDGDFGVARVGLTKEKFDLQVVPNLAFKDKPVILAAPGGKEGLALGREGTDQTRPFTVRKLGADGRAGNPVSIDLKVDNGVESWDAVQYGTGYNIAYVDGDSLIGQAELKVAGFNWKDDAVNTGWSKGVILKDVHVSDPVFLATSKGLQVMTLNWVDDESTIARYGVAAGSLGKPVYSGIFPKGSRIVEAFNGNDPSESFVIMRHKDDSSWSFKLCRL